MWQQCRILLLTSQIPQGDWIKKIFNPLIIVFATIIFLIMGYVGSFNYRFENPVNNQVILTVIFSIVVFSIGYLITTKFNLKNKNIVILNEKSILIITIIALILQCINLILLGGIPLLDSTLKSNATTNIWRVAYPLFLIFLNILLYKHYNRKYLLLIILGGFIFGLNGYRTSVLGILGSSFITLSFLEKITEKMIAVFILIIITGVLSMGYIASQSIANQTWTLNPVELIFYRAAFTLEVLEKIIPLHTTTNGHILSMIFSSGSPRTFIGEYVLHYTVCLTSTIFGPVLLDFGYVGLTLQMLIISTFLGFLYKLKSQIWIYSIILIHTIIWIETGPTDIMIWFFYFIGLIILFLNKYKNN